MNGTSRSIASPLANRVYRHLYLAHISALTGTGVVTVGLEPRIHLRPERTERIGAPAGDDGIVPGGSKRAEERDVGLIEPFEAGGSGSSPVIVQLPAAVVAAVLVHDPSVSSYSSRR